MNPLLSKATFAAGCFWGVEKAFGEVAGVISTRVGYTGGAVPNPSYKQVCSGNTDHAEAVEVIYDPRRVSYEALLETFFMNHDPTQLNRQGPDIGTQYRSAIFTHSPEQDKAARRAVRLLNESRLFAKPVVTEIAAAGSFYEAEDYHQKYLVKNPHGYCSIKRQPEKLREILRASNSISS